MARRLPFRKSLREQRESSNATQAWYASAMDDGPRKDAALERLAQERAAIKPKRVRRKRTAADGPSEHQEQAAVIKWWWLNHRFYGLPVEALFAIPNGGARDVITGARLKAEGVRKGSPDLMMAVPTGAFHGLFIEMKVGRNTLTEEQDSFGKYLNGVGYRFTGAWSAAEAVKYIQDYLPPPF